MAREIYQVIVTEEAKKEINEIHKDVIVIRVIHVKRGSSFVKKALLP